MRLLNVTGRIWHYLVAIIVLNGSWSKGLAADAEFALRCRSLFLEDSTAFSKFESLGIFNREVHLHRPLTSVGDRSFGTSVPIVRSFEKEGLFYEEIAEWFPILRPSGIQKLKARFEEEKTLTGERRLHGWLNNLKIEAPKVGEQFWVSATLEQKMDLLLNRENPFELLSVKDRSFLFEFDFLNFNDIAAGSKAPPLVTVGDDLGSYEVRLSRGVVDRVQFHELRDQVEQYLEGKIGHQHLFHAWPSELGLRKEIAPYYIELLDSSTWYLFWRQMNRNPEEVDSVLAHPFLGVYTRRSLDRLQKALIKDQPEKFKDKYRMIGARSFSAAAEIPEQEGMVPDWEIRSGNKGNKREFIENLLIARLETGDYSGLKDYQSYEFNPSASMREIISPWLDSRSITEAQLKLIESFEAAHPNMKWSAHANAKNHFRNRILSPLLPWQNRLSLGYKGKLFADEQNIYLKKLVAIADNFLKSVSAGTKSVSELRAEALENLQMAVYVFSTKTRLDLDFERYLRPRPMQIPSIAIKASKGPLNINQLDLGIEYSFRMPFEMNPETREQADLNIRGFAEQFSKREGQGEIEKTETEGHGHGIAVKYKVIDRDGQAWRFEWDGIQRNYDADGNVTNAWGGHIEVVTPKFSPQSIDGSIRELYKESRQRGLEPRRSAGGAHVNFDLTPLMKNFPAKEGTRRLINLISYFESNEPLILFLWQHPKRQHAAYPVRVSEDGARRLFEFEGDWKQLGTLLYDIRYFNTYVGRKPKYVPLNLTALMTSIVPEKYLEKTLDIRNQKQDWFPNFNKVYDRGEARFFDAPVNEATAALQIKYFRALLDKGLNADKKILLVQRYNMADVAQWKGNVDEWLQAITAHLVELGLDPKEFRSLLWDSWMNQVDFEPSQKDLQKFETFEPAKK
ncbi:MAG: hypothetical protein RJB66_268 [Pseudomonadota bacterium]|jgi:hypothetical protein